MVIIFIKWNCMCNDGLSTLVGVIIGAATAISFSLSDRTSIGAKTG